jgi:hypothetical protein
VRGDTRLLELKVKRDTCRLHRILFEEPVPGGVCLFWHGHWSGPVARDKEATPDTQQSDYYTLA